MVRIIVIVETRRARGGQDRAAKEALLGGTWFELGLEYGERLASWVREEQVTELDSALSWSSVKQALPYDFMALVWGSNEAVCSFPCYEVDSADPIW